MLRSVHRHVRPEPIRADIPSDDEEIARRNLRQKSVLVAERNDSHDVCLNPGGSLLSMHAERRTRTGI
jgi:hypothetical protein